MVDLLKVKWENDHELINHVGFLGLLYSSNNPRMWMCIWENSQLQAMGNCSNIHQSGCRPRLRKEHGCCLRGLHFTNFLQPPLNQESSTIYGIYESGLDVIPLPRANQSSSGITNSRTGKMRGSIRSICRYHRWVWIRIG